MTSSTPKPPVIQVQRLSKSYRRMGAGFRLRTLKSALLERSLTGGLAADESIAALSEVSFEVAPGEAYGVIGGNGSGKSTLLKLLAGLIQPSSGSIQVAGRVAALIELGAGFHPEISGRENIFINGSVLGLERREIERRFDEIVDFSGLADFIDEPVKNYSSGMYVRLGFSVAIHTEPDVLLVDEVLAVGDEAFAHRCLRRIEEFLAEGRSILFVSHSLELIEDLCDRVLWLERGVPRLEGSPRRVIDAYRAAVATQEGEEHKREHERRAQEDGDTDQDSDGADASQSSTRWGNRQAEIVDVRLRSQGEESFSILSGAPLTVQIEAVAHEELDDFVFGIAIRTPRNQECWGTNSDLSDWVPERFCGQATIELTCPSLRLAPGEYHLDVAVHSRGGVPYDYRKGLLHFTVHSPTRGVGVYFPEHSWSASGDIVWRPPKRAEPSSAETQPEAETAAPDDAVQGASAGAKRE